MRIMNKDIVKYMNYISNIPEFLNNYLDLDIMKRLKNIGYFCGMDYASKDIYNFKYDITRYDHSITTALLTYRFTESKKETIAALFHDISTPCFSHVIDYMNKDYETQESTEEKTESILKNSLELKKLLISDNLNIADISNFKQYSVVDNDRPKMCADRLDGIILTSLAWTKTLNMKEIPNILDNITLYKNEDEELEIGFKTENLAQYIYELNDKIDIYCHTKEDIYMMELLANITKYAIKNNYITYDDLYKLDEDKLFAILKRNAINDSCFNNLIHKFESIDKNDIDNINLPKVKKRIINPLVNGIRLY